MEAAGYFGLPAQNQQLDQFMTAHGFAGRPLFTGSPVARVSRHDLGLSLQFNSLSAYEHGHGPAREIGEMIFSAVMAYGALNDSSYDAYRGVLPFGINLRTTLEEATARLGAPTVTHPSGGNEVYVWYGMEGFTVSLCMLPDDRGLSFFALQRVGLTRPVQVDW